MRRIRQWKHLALLIALVVVEVLEPLTAHWSERTQILGGIIATLINIAVLLVVFERRWVRSLALGDMVMSTSRDGPPGWAVDFDDPDSRPVRRRSRDRSAELGRRPPERRLPPVRLETRSKAIRKLRPPRRGAPASPEKPGRSLRDQCRRGLAQSLPPVSTQR